jgi:hypothetical protein
MREATQFDPERVRLVLDQGEVVELDGGTLVLDGEESASVVLRLAPWRARAVARVLEEWWAVSEVFGRPTRALVDELSLSRMLVLAASMVGDREDPGVRVPRGVRAVPSRQRLAAVAVLAERESRLSAVQRIAVVDAAAWWLSDPAGGTDLARELLAAACAEEVTTQQAYLALITPPDDPDGDPSAATSS